MEDLEYCHQKLVNFVEEKVPEIGYMDSYGQYYEPDTLEFFGYLGPNETIALYNVKDTFALLCWYDLDEEDYLAAQLSL